MTKVTSNKISTCLWFDEQAGEATNFYVSLFDDAKILTTVPYLIDAPSNKPMGSVMTVDFVIEGFRFTALNGGTHFTPNTSVFFLILIHRKTRERRKTLSDPGMSWPAAARF